MSHSPRLPGLFVALALPIVASAQTTTTTTSAGGGTTTTVTQGQPTVEVPAVGTGAISGVVTDGSTLAPLAGAFVHLSGAGVPTAARMGQLTDGRGRFLFTHLPAFPDYVVSVTRPGYMAGGYKRVPGLLTVARIALRDAEWMQTADVTLWKPASITGTVRDELGDPVVGVPVRAVVRVIVAGRRQLASGPATETDDRGMYRLANLEPGEYVIHVPSVQVTLPATTMPTRVGPPSPPNPSASPTSAIPDVPAIVRAAGDSGVLVGHFATPSPGAAGRAYPMAFHPAARSVDEATPVTIGFGEHLENVDVQLSLAPTVSVSGRVIGSVGAVARLPIRLVPTGSEGLASGAEAAFTQTDAQGAFTLLHVPEGEYTLLAARSMSEFTLGGASTSDGLIPRSALMITSMSAGQVPGANGVSFATRATAGDVVSGRMPLSVGNRDVTGLDVTVSSGVTVSGHYVWDGLEAPPDALRLQPFLRLEPADGDMSLGVKTRTSLRTAGAALPSPVPFTLEGVMPGRYVVSQTETVGYGLERIEWNGRDLLTSPLDVDGSKDIDGIVVRMTSKRITVSGSVRDADGRVATSGAVLTFPASPALWRNIGLSAQLFRTSTIVSGGAYRVDGLVPGEYLLVAVPDADRKKWVDPDFLASVAGMASRIRVEPGSVVTQELRLSGGRR